MMQGKRVYVVSALMLIISIILIRILAVQLTNYCLTPKVGQSYSAYYILTMYNGVNCNDSLASTIVEFSKIYH